MSHRFRWRGRAVSERNILQEKIQYRKGDHQYRADHEDPPNSMKQSCAYLNIQRSEQVRSIFITAEDRFQLRPHLRHQYGIRKRHHSLLWHIVRKCSLGEIVVIVRE